MRESKAKNIRKALYGDFGSGREFRRYSKLNNGQIVSDGRRRLYQNAKKV